MGGGVTIVNRITSLEDELHFVFLWNEMCAHFSMYLLNLYLVVLGLT
jgi:hypothetical protein